MLSLYILFFFSVSFFCSDYEATTLLNSNNAVSYRLMILDFLVPRRELKFAYCPRYNYYYY